MDSKIYSKIIGTGSYLPTVNVDNNAFLNTKFYDEDGKLVEKSGNEIIDTFQKITTISERRYVSDDQVTSDIAFLAGKDAIENSGIDKESLDYIIVAHNFGDVKELNRRTDIVPSIAARVKYFLQIHNPSTVAYDINFGCPGWLQGVIQADYFIKSGDAKRILVIGADVLSRVSDPHDRDSMLYADGAGAIVLEAIESDKPIGILAHNTRTDTFYHSTMLYMGGSYNPELENRDELYLKMSGRKLYQYALETVPSAIKASLEKCNVNLGEISKVFIHQANGKMDDAILKRLYQLCEIPEIPPHIMPMTVDWLGNSSVATVPTLLDLVFKNKIDNHTINKGEYLIFASVGAGMSINAMVYKA
ncbi:MAG: ketoacyl-ACP synthase III [Bacteroidales bacterium]|nr:ketoacyl-ACP synthase III [Bacteroidales bacterium]